MNSNYSMSSRLRCFNSPLSLQSSQSCRHNVYVRPRGLRIIWEILQHAFSVHVAGGSKAIAARVGEEVWSQEITWIKQRQRESAEEER